MKEAFRVLLQFGGVTAIALIGVVTFHVLCDLCGHEGVEGVRKMRERLYRD